MTTPEHKVKAKVKALLAKHAETTWWFMPECVSTRGVPDFVGACRGRAFLIETKSERGRLSKLQEHFIDCARERGTVCFVVRDEIDLEPVWRFLNDLG